MLKDITIGQYFPGNSPVHRMDPRMKLIITVVYVVMLFVARGLPALIVAAIFLIVVYPVSRISGRMIFKSLKPILPIILITVMLNMFFIDGEIVWQWRFLSITQEGIAHATLLGGRIICLISGSSLLTYTTSPIALTDGIEQLFSPLKRIKMPVHEVAMMMTIALRFIPTLIEETEKIIDAQKARGADMESGSLIKRVRAMVPILIPLFVSAFRRAEELAMAMECRCYHGGEGRTRMKVLRLARVDAIGAVFAAGYIGAVIMANMMISVFSIVL